MSEGLRLAELIAALSLATDLGMGQPLEQALRTCLVAVALGERLGLDGEELSEIYYVALLRFLGCTADAHEWAEMVGGDEIAVRAAIAPVLGGQTNEFASRVMPAVGAGHNPLRRARLVAGMMAHGRGRAREGLRAHCEVGENLAQRLGLPAGVRTALAAAFEQWNGEGLPDGLAGEAIPLAARVVFLARDLEVIQRQGGTQAAQAAVRRRRGRAYDPAVAQAFLSAPAEVLAGAHAATPWEDVLEREPEPRPWVPEVRLDAVLGVFADFVDLKAPFTAGHSREVALLAGEAGGPDSVPLRRAGLLHDLGRASVPNGIWEKPGPLTGGEWERVRLHAYYSERIVGRVRGLAHLAPLVGMHHERLDGSGYHRASSRGEIPRPARLLAAADAYQAMTQPRPHRPALAPDRAAQELEAMAAAGRLDSEAVRALLTAAGHRLRSARRSWPAGLSEREVEVLRLICRGGTKKEVAASLSISPSTVDHHVRHIYDKAGVQTRAGAALFALEHDLLK
ncbi:MAG: HD domain-containing protein [Candidatus Dormibacteraeota bacterium]|nr:HD domain-containing protein [Candidatus Dormibacteraeota bacterium]